MVKKVLLVTNIPSPYNVELFYYLQTHVKQYKFYVLYYNKTESNRQWNIDESKIIDSYFANSKVFKIKTPLDYRYIHIVTSVEKIFNKIAPDIIISWEYNPTSVRALMWCKVNKKKFISVSEGTLLTEQNLWFIQKLTRKYIAKNADAFLVSGTKAEEKILSWGISRERIYKALLTVDISIFKNSTRNLNENIILYVGSMVKRKGIDLLIRALPKIHNNYILRIVGNGSSEEIHQLKTLAEDQKVSDRIVWCGFKCGEDLVKEYQQASVFVMPTREDCFGLVLLEALAAGVPIVTSKFADGAYDTVEEGKTGWIINPYDSLEFASAIDKVLDDITFQENCYLYSRKLIQKFEYENVIKGYISALNFVSDTNEENC